MEYRRLRAVFDTQGLEVVFDQFGIDGVYTLLNEWRTKPQWLNTKHPFFEIRVYVAPWIGDQSRIRDMYVHVALSGGEGGGSACLLNDDVRRLAGVLEDAQESSYLNEYVGAGNEWVRVSRGATDDPRVRNADQIRFEVSSRYAPRWVGLDEDEAQTVKGFLSHARLDVDLFTVVKQHADRLIEEAERA